MFNYLKQLVYTFLLVLGLSEEAQLSATYNTQSNSIPGQLKVIPIQSCNSAEPFAVLTASSLQELLIQTLKVSDNIYPQSSSILTLLAMNFLGNMQCPGLSEKTPCFLAFHYYQNTCSPIFAFHATKNCPLVKNLSLASKTSTNGLLLPFQNADTQATWYLYGAKNLLKLIAKNITLSAP